MADNMNQTVITDFYPQNLNTSDEMKQTYITDYFPKKQLKVYGYNSATDSWHCTECGVDMGPHNPRQVCGKWRCLGYGY